MNKINHIFNIKNVFSYSILVLGMILLLLFYPKQALAATSATVVSTNLLTGVSGAITSINSFVYNLSAKPTGTTATVQFSQDGSTWKNSAGTVDGTDPLTTGTNNSITLSSLSWSGANFYYKVAYGGDGSNTPVLDDVTVNYTVFTDCSSIPMSGNYSLASDCAFPGTVNGVDAGTGTTNTAVLTTGAGTSLTVLNGQTVAVGSLSLTGGAVTIIDGGSIKIGAPIWVTDADADGYPANTTQIAQASTPTNGRRRNLLTTLTQVDSNDASACATNGASAGACKTCLNGAPNNTAAGTDPDNDCTSSYNACSGNNRVGPDGNCDGAGACNTGGLSDACATAGTCQTGGGCSGGSCTSVSNVAYGTQGSGCTSTHYVCNGSGSCIVPTYNQCFSGNSCCDPGRPYYTCYYGPTYLGYPRANNAGCVDSYSSGNCSSGSMGCGNGIYPASVLCATYSY